MLYRALDMNNALGCQWKLAETPLSLSLMTPTLRRLLKVCVYSRLHQILKNYSGAIGCKFRCSGQTCVCANRIYVHSSVYADFASRLAERVSQFKIGNGLEEGVIIGPLIHSRAAEKVQRHIEDAVAKGAQILIGGKKIESTSESFFMPTVLCDVPSNALLSTEETFGPLAALIKFETEEEVIQMANNTDSGLAGYFYSRDIGRIWRVAERLEVGMVGVNSPIVGQAVSPFGGIKESGLGREGGPRGISEFMNEKLIVFGGIDGKM